MMKQRSAQPPQTEKQVKPAPPPTIKVQPATMMDVIMIGSVISRPPPSRKKVIISLSHLTCDLTRSHHKAGSVGYPHSATTESGHVDDSPRRPDRSFGGSEEATR